MSTVKFVDLDQKDDRVYGIASGVTFPFPNRDDRFLTRLDRKYVEEAGWKAKWAEQARRDGRREESFADVFVEYMDLFEYD